MKKTNIKKPLIIAAASTAVIASGLILQSNASAATASVNIYRLYNANTGEHLYTSSVLEKNSLFQGGWAYEGVGYKESTTGTPVYRVYNPNAKGGDHYYTSSKGEANSLVSKGWRWDNNKKPVFYSSGNVPVYVAYNPNAKSGSHNYTSNAGEQNTLLKQGWKFGKVAWKATTSAADITSPASQIVSADLPDPTILKVGNTYYAYGTNSAGRHVPVAVSTNGGKTYTIKGDALPKIPSYAIPSKPEQKWVTGPEVVKIGNKYVMYVDVRQGNRYVIATATSSSPLGPFTPTATPVVSAPIGNSFDPNVVKVGNSLYLAYSTDGKVLGANIYMRQLSADGMRAGSAKLILDHKNAKAPGNKSTVRVESPAIMKAPDGYYVMFFAVNDAKDSNYATNYGISKSITGPYVDKGTVMTTSNTKTSGPGEASLFTDGNSTSLIYNGWVGQHNGFTIITGGRYVFSLKFGWYNGHVPVFN